MKGLERPVVVLCVNGFRVERAREILYTGLSRASSLLVVVGPRALVEEIGGEAVQQRLRAAQPWSAGVVG
ncbi:ATP-binding domain-containing protein [Georgenia sp. AZ-5]|uniref:ATP-binding domain-containing protein n=1 Tax=Georgenia sp. AZ-5 TaxID=3367526 RepID=UPI0037544885